MMQKAFILSLIIWNSFTFASGNSPRHLHFALGCPAVIPCQHNRGDSDSFKWIYKKDEHSQKIKIFFQDKKGMQYYHDNHPQRRVKYNRSLVITYFSEDDQGLYWCENCHQSNCNSEQSTVFRVKKEILDEIHKTVYVTEGSAFTHECPGEFANVKWAFEASNTTALGILAVRSKTDFVNSTKSIHIVDVKRADAGKYTCWISRCRGHRHKLLTINLCVVKVYQSGDSPVSCDEEFSNSKSNMSNEETGTRTLSVNLHPYMSLNFSAKQICDVYRSVNCTLTPSNRKTGTEPEYRTAVIYGTSAALACLTLVSLLILYFRQRLWADFSNCPSGCGIDARLEEEPPVVYSLVVLRRPDQTTNNHMTCYDGVYSEINVRV